MRNLNPFLIVLIYIAAQIIFTILYIVFVPSYGGESLEFAAKSITYLPMGILVVTILSAFFYKKWALKYWWVILLLLLTGGSIFIKYFVYVFIYHQHPAPLF